MKLGEYLILEKISERRFAAILGVSQAHVNNIVRGRKSPSLRLSNKIEISTGGKVSMQDLFHLRDLDKNKEEKVEKKIPVIGG